MLVSEEEAPRTVARGELPRDRAAAARAARRRARAARPSTGREYSSADEVVEPDARSCDGCSTTRDEGPDRARHPARDHPAQPRDRAARRAVRARVVHTGPELRSGAQRRLLRRARGAPARPPPRRSSGEDFGERVGAIMAAVAGPARAERPDRLLVLGDTDSALAAFVAKRMGMPVFHMEAGNRCFDDRVPEEVNRRVIDQCSDVLMPYTERSRENLLREGFHPSASLVDRQPDQGGAGPPRRADRGLHRARRLGLERGEYLLLTLHRQETVDSTSGSRAARRGRRGRRRRSACRWSSASTRGRASGSSGSGSPDPPLRPVRAVRLLRLRRARARGALRAHRQRHGSGGVLHPGRAGRDGARVDRAPGDDRVRQQRPGGGRRHGGAAAHRGRLRRASRVGAAARVPRGRRSPWPRWSPAHVAAPPARRLELSAARPRQGGPRGGRDPGRGRLRRLPRAGDRRVWSCSTSPTSPVSFGAAGARRRGILWGILPRHARRAVPGQRLRDVPPVVARGGEFGSVGVFAVRRAARLVPAYWVCLVIARCCSRRSPLAGVCRASARCAHLDHRPDPASLFDDGLALGFGVITARLDAVGRDGLLPRAAVHRRLVVPAALGRPGGAAVLFIAWRVFALHIDGVAVLSGSTLRRDEERFAVYYASQFPSWGMALGRRDDGRLAVREAARPSCRGAARPAGRVGHARPRSPPGPVRLLAGREAAEDPNPFAGLFARQSCVRRSATRSSLATSCSPCRSARAAAAPGRQPPDAAGPPTSPTACT